MVIEICLRAFHTSDLKNRADPWGCVSKFDVACFFIIITVWRKNWPQQRSHEADLGKGFVVITTSCGMTLLFSTDRVYRRWSLIPYPTRACVCVCVSVCLCFYLQIWSTRSMDEMVMMERELQEIAGEEESTEAFSRGRFSVHLHLTGTVSLLARP